MPSPIRVFHVSHEEGHTESPGGEKGPNKAVADSIRVELQRLRQMEKDLEAGDIQPTSDVRSPSDPQASVPSPPSTKGITNKDSIPVFPSKHYENSYVVDLGTSGGIRVKDKTENKEGTRQESSPPRAPSSKYLQFYLQRQGIQTSPVDIGVPTAGQADPLVVIQPFTATGDDVESGISDVRSSILELRAKREQKQLVAMLEIKATIGRTFADDELQKPLSIANSIPNTISQEMNQHGLFVQANTQRLRDAVESAAAEAAREIDRLPFQNSKIGKEFEQRQRRVFSAHVERAHSAELSRQQEQIKSFVNNYMHQGTQRTNNSLAQDSRAVVAASGTALPLTVSSFVVTDNIPSTLPKASHGAVVAEAYQHVLQDSAKGKPIVSLDDLPEEPRVLVQLTSIIPICGKTAFTLPFTLATPLRALHNHVLELARLPGNIERVEGEEHARTASAIYPHSRTYLQTSTTTYKGEEYKNATPLYEPKHADCRKRPPRPITRPGSTTPQTAEGGITLHIAGSDVPLDLDKSFLDLGYRHPPVISIRGFRLEYYLATAGSDRRIPCPWRPHMTLTDVAKDIAKRLFPKDFRLVRVSIDSEDKDAVPSKMYLDLAKSIRFVTPDLIEDDSLPLTAFGIGSSVPDRPRVLQFVRTVLGRPVVATLNNVDPNASLRTVCQEAAEVCRAILDADIQAEVAAHTVGAELGRASTADGAAITPIAMYAKTEASFDDVEEEISPNGHYRIFRHSSKERETGIPTFSFNPNQEYMSEATFPYFITNEEDYTISHASDKGVLPGVDVLVEFFDSYRKVWSGDVLTPKEAMYHVEGAKLPNERQIIGRNIVSATTSRRVPYTEIVDYTKEAKTDSDHSKQSIQRLLSPSSSQVVAPASATQGFYPISGIREQLDRIAYYPQPTDVYDLLTIICERGQRLRMFATAKTTTSQILDFVWSQTGDQPQETYLWLDHGKRLAGQYDTLESAGVGPGGTIHARHRPRLWLGEALVAPIIDRTLSFSSVPDILAI